MRDLACHLHHPRKYSECGCELPQPPTKPQLSDTCKWCFATFANPFCQRFGHWRMAVAEYEAAKEFYEKYYGVKIARPAESLAPTAKSEITDAMRQYFAENGRKGGRSRSAAKVASSARNIKIASGRQP
jgi:hypothetical protein